MLLFKNRILNVNVSLIRQLDAQLRSRIMAKPNKQFSGLIGTNLAVDLHSFGAIN